MWWEQAVIYQVYVRSFQDTNGDGVGDLPGVTQRLGHIAELGVQAVWLSPIYPSPNADFGYDVSDFRSVDPAFGTLEDLDALVSRAGQLGLKVLLDFVPCHTSIEHPWFREHPDYYVWADAPNNWRAAFGGSSWGRDERSGRYFLHSFFPEQADLNWRNPDVREQMTAAMRFWVDRGIDGFRLDALDRLMKDSALRDDPPATHPPELPGDPQDLELDHVHSRNAPDIGDALQAIRHAVGDVLLVGEVYLPIAEAVAYLAALDVVFNFEEIFAVRDAAKLRQAVDTGIRAGGQGWVLSNHDFSRLVTRAGPENARAVALLLLSLPGPVFMFQGDELGFGDAPMAGPEQDRNHRDPFRAPMVWDNDADHGGFSTAPPWLTPTHPPAAGAVQQAQDPTSVLTFTRRAMAVRSRLAANETSLLPSEPGTIALRRGDHVVAVNLTDVPAPAPAAAGTLVLEARPGDGADLSVIPAHGGWIAL
ncbi:MAG TPA: alpha-amylase family glycosyl hydrolase [Solirubrobacteraceae bacterium]|nr:alpha-amylase family glycosyl hydrolase [Solirubrobacteraceae bacterium]